MFPPIQNTLQLFWNTFPQLILPMSCTRKCSSHYWFCPPKLHLLVFQVKWVDVILAGNKIASVFSEMLHDASVKNMPLRFCWCGRTFLTASHVHVIHIWGVWAPSQVVDRHMASYSHHCHHRHFPRFEKVGWIPTFCKCANYATMLLLRW